MTARPRIDAAQRRARLSRRHRLALTQRSDDVVDIANSLVALHSSDPVSVYLSATARMVTPSLGAMSAALYEERTLVRHHGMRRTIWVYTPEVARLVHAACTADIADAEWRQLAKWAAASGIEDPDAWIVTTRAAALEALQRLGPSTARQLGRDVPALATKITVGSGRYTVEQSAHTRLLLNLGFEAAIVRTVPTGSWVSSEYVWCAMVDWLPEGIVGADPTSSRNRLAARYLRSFGPVTTADLQWWTGWTVRAAKAAVTAIDAVEVDLDDDQVGWVLPDDVEPVGPTEPWVALLPGLDPTAMGWKGRAWYFGDLGTFGGPLFDRNGNAGPTVWVNGEVVGGWAQRQDGVIAYELLAPVDRRVQRTIDAAAADLRSVVGDARITPRFPAPIQKNLVGPA